jgi:hypothetical protein
MNFNSVKESNTFASNFYKFVLPQLVDSLHVLKIQPKLEGRWCYNPKDVFQSVALSRCNKLRSLSVAINSTSFVLSLDGNRVIHQYKANHHAVCLDDFTFHPCLKGFCRSHHSSTYHSAYLVSVRFVL